MCDGLAVGDASNAARESGIVDCTRCANLLPLHFRRLLHALWYPPISVGLHDLEIVVWFLGQHDARQIPNRHDEKIRMILRGTEPLLSRATGLDNLGF